MLLYYERIMGETDNEKKNIIQVDYELLQIVKNGVQDHHNTKFYCMGKSFKDRTERTTLKMSGLCACKERREVEVAPLYQYIQNFNKFQQLIRRMILLFQLIIYK